MTVPKGRRKFQEEEEESGFSFCLGSRGLSTVGGQQKTDA
jgi:hypothetical protein